MISRNRVVRGLNGCGFMVFLPTQRSGVCKAKILIEYGVIEDDQAVHEQWISPWAAQMLNPEDPVCRTLECVSPPMLCTVAREIAPSTPLT